MKLGFRVGFSGLLEEIGTDAREVGLGLGVRAEGFLSAGIFCDLSGVSFAGLFGVEPQTPDTRP